MADAQSRWQWDGFVLSQYVLNLGPRRYWNARTGEIARVSEDVYKALNHPEKKRFGSDETLHKLHPHRQDELKQAGMLVRADVDEVEEILRETRKAVELAPPVFRVFTTTGCNANCPYCYERGIAAQSMDDETAEAVARYIAFAYRKRGGVDPVRIEWFGGEPLLNPDAISRICEALRGDRVPFRSFVFTNGMLLDAVPPEVLRELWQVDALQVTLDGASGEYEAVKGVPQGTFDRVLGNVGRVLEGGLHVVLRINYDGDTSRAVRLVDALADRFQDAPTEARPAIDVVPLYRPGREIPAERMHAVLDIYDYLISLGMADAGKVYSLQPRQYGCFMASCGGHTIMPDGSLVNCSHLAQGEERVGDVFHPGRMGAARDAFIRRDFSPECRACDLLPVCRGGCRAAELGLCGMHQCHPYKNVLRRVLDGAPSVNVNIGGKAGS